MRHLLFLVLLGIVSCLACAPLTMPPSPIEAAPASSDPVNDTVALVTDDDRAYCAGTWVAPDKILTASHCVVDEDTNEAPDSVHVRDYDGVIFEGAVVKVDLVKDLALLRAPHAHAWAPVALEWHQGEELTIIGHPESEEWVWMRGWISKWLQHPSPMTSGTMAMLQVEAPVWYGNSGGGAFDASGHLVGVCSMRNTKVPDLGLFVAPEEIHAFLAK